MEKKWQAGIDISKGTLDVAVFDTGNGRGNENYLKVGNGVSGCKVMRQWFRDRGMEFADIVVCMEYTGICGDNILKFLEQNAIGYGMETPVRIRKSPGPAGGKSDRTDTFRVAWYCYVHREFLRLSRLPGETVRQLQRLPAERGKYVKHSACHRQVLSEHSILDGRAASAGTKSLRDKTKKAILAVEKQMYSLIASDESP